MYQKSSWKTFNTLYPMSAYCANECELIFQSSIINFYCIVQYVNCRR